MKLLAIPRKPSWQRNFTITPPNGRRLKRCMSRWIFRATKWRSFRGSSVVEGTRQIAARLLLQKGDIIEVVQMNKSGLWKGVFHNRIGHFKFINVEILNDRVPRRGEPDGRGKWGQRYRQKPGSVQELLQRMNLQVESNIFPRLEQTDSHLHCFECKAGNLLLYVSLFASPLPFHPCHHHRHPRHHPLHPLPRIPFISRITPSSMDRGEFLFRRHFFTSTFHLSSSFLFDSLLLLLLSNVSTNAHFAPFTGWFLRVVHMSGFNLVLTVFGFNAD